MGERDGAREDTEYADAADADDVAGEGDSGAGEPPDEAAVSRAEQVVMVVAIAVTVGLFAFAGWQALAGSSTVDPSANVTDVRGTGENVTYYGVTLRNEGDAGLVSATVGVACPEPTRRITFENVPADAHRNATVSCPNGTDPSAQVVSWVPA